MKFRGTELPGCFIIEPNKFADDRGMFRRQFDNYEFEAEGMTPQIQQINISENKASYTLRGFHHQVPPCSEGKTLVCLRGAIHDLVVDLRPDSPMFRKWISIELDDENRLSVHVPPGCANAFLTLKPHTLIAYWVSERYAPEMERGIRYNDPGFKFEWPREPEVISDKDRSWPDFNADDRTLRELRG